MHGFWLTLALFVNTLAALLLNLHSFAFVRHPPWCVRADAGGYIGMGVFNLGRTGACRR